MDRAIGPSSELMVLQRRRRFSLFLWQSAAARYVLKVARTVADDAAITAEFEALHRVAAAGALSPDAYPHPVAIGTIGVRAASLTTEVWGDKRLLWEPISPSTLGAVATTLERLADSTRHSVPASLDRTQALLARMAGMPLDGLPAEIKDLAVRTASLMSGSSDRSAVLVHGDCTAANLLMSPDGPGLIDWSMASEDGFEHFDALWLAWYLLIKRLNTEPADAVRQLVAGPSPRSELRPLLLRWGTLCSANRERLVALLLTVLAGRHAAEGHAERSATFAALAAGLLRGAAPLVSA